MQALDLAVRDVREDGAPDPDAVRAELNRVLASPDLHASERRREFLRYIVEETLEGRADRLKGYSVAVAVFGRDDDFDAQADPVVRLEARRLRRDLDSYYVDAGSHDPIRISIPKGSYVPRFDWRSVSPPETIDHATAAEAAAGPRPSAVVEVAAPLPPDASASEPPRAAGGGLRARSLVIVLCLAALIAAAIAAGGFMLLWNRDQPTDAIGEPAMVVLPFRSLSESDNGRYLAEGLGEVLVADLVRFPGLRLYTLSASEAEAPPTPAALARDANVTYVVSGSVVAAGDEVRVAAQMLDASTGEVLWSSIYDRPFTADALIRTQNSIAGEIATVLGQPYGVVGNDLGDRLATPQVADMQSYVCVLRAYAYRRGFSKPDYEPVLACLEQAVQRDPAYADAWAMLGWLRLDGGRFGYGAGDDAQTEYANGLAAAERALALEPGNTLALKAASSINHYMGRYDEAERLARRAVALNPNDPDALAQLGWRLAVRDKFEDGIPILKQAIERTVNPPGWYFHLVAIDQYLKGRYREMLDTAERSAVDGSGVSQALLAIAAGELGDRELARASLARMDVSGLMAKDPAAFFRRNGATDHIVDALMAGLDKARELIRD